MGRLLLLVSATAVLSMGCDSKDYCRSLQLGQRVGGLPGGTLSTATPFGFPGLMKRQTFGETDRGPVDHHLCCFSHSLGTTYDWCEPAMLECSDPGFQDVQIAHLQEPYSEQNVTGDYAFFCFVAIKDDRIVAIWNRSWS